MRTRLPLGLKITLATITVALVAASGEASEKVLHNFGISGTDGQAPLADLIFDSSGNLYGTTDSGGSVRAGTVFELTPNGSGGWTEKVLHSFGISDTDGRIPKAGLIFDGAGNLYGTTCVGGREHEGTVFKMTPNGSGGWTERILHNFGRDTDGQQPEGALMFDGAGNLYGTTIAGGSRGHGTVFEMTPDGSGGWTERVLHNFGINDNDGQLPYASLIFDDSGNLYGTASGGGRAGHGMVFEMTPNGSGGWTERVLHNFGVSDNDGRLPIAGVILDGAGNLYGGTVKGGTVDEGTVFEMTPNGGGWTERVLHNFGVSNNDGQQIWGGLILDGAGNLYGTTALGGSLDWGTVFEMTPNGSGGWTERVLHNLGFTNSDGQQPYGSLIFDAVGNLYGTTLDGGNRGRGVVFEVVR